MEKTITVSITYEEDRVSIYLSSDQLKERIESEVNMVMIRAMPLRRLQDCTITVS